MKYQGSTSKVTNYPPVNQGREPDYSETSAGLGGRTMVDPSVRLGELKGEPLGSVAMETTMGKPRAYYPSKGGPK